MGMVDQMDGGFAHFDKIVRRHVRRHTDGNAAGSIHEKIGHFARQVRRLFPLLIVVWNEIDGFLVDVLQQGLGERCHAGLRVPHRGWRIAIDRAEVSLAIHKRVPV